MVANKVVTGYLFIYNIAQFCGWAAVFVRTIQTTLASEGDSMQVGSEVYVGIGQLVGELQSFYKWLLLI